MSKKICKACRTSKPLSEFHRNCRMADGHLNVCRECTCSALRQHYQTDIGKRVRAIWSALLQRIGNANGKNPSYADVELRMTKEQFIAWAVPAYTRFMAENPGVKPSIDRRKTDGHYELGNLRVIGWGNNSRIRRGNKNVFAPPGKAWCCICEHYKPRTAFHRNKAQKHGLENRCKVCTSEINKEATRIVRERLAANRVVNH